MIEILRLRQAHVVGLHGFHAALEAAGDTSLFAPHPFTTTFLRTLCEPQRKDLHYVLVDGETVLGYGILRGWDEGFAVPSLGLAIHPQWRRAHFGLTMMHFLHAAARAAAATKVRLRVHPSNARAQALYERMGYRFEAATDSTGLRVALKELS